MCALRAHDAAQHHVAPSPAPGPAHRCGICGKVFGRRDLRDRHKRRCVHKFSKPKRSKRKSCRACAVSKLGCDQGQPSCRRCLSRNLPCEYMGATVDTTPGVALDGGLRGSRGESHDPGAGCLGSTSHDAPKNDAITRQFVGLDEDDSFLYIDDASGEEVESITSSSQSISTVGVEGNLFGSMGLPATLTGAAVTYSAAMGDAVSASALPIAVPDHAPVHTRWYPGVEPGNHGALSLLKHTAGDANKDSRLPYDSFGVSGDMDWTGTQLDRGDMAFDSLWNDVQGASTHLTPNNLGTSPAPSRIHRTASVSNTNHALSARRGSRYTDRRAPKSPDKGGDVTMSPEDMASLIRGYLPMMSTHEKPPFVHRQLYRHSEGPIARAMVCTNAFAGATQSSQNFAHEIVKAERDRLVKAFPRCNSETDMLAALHAMVIYQALDLFSDSAEQNRSGELHQPFLLKMCRKVARKYRRDLVRDAGNTAPSAWRYWCLIETLRRTFFLVHAINVLAMRLRKQDAYFYEPLDDDLVLDMPLPSPAPLWEASLEEEWRARGSLTWRPTTGRMMQQEHMTLPAGTDAFTRTIVATLFDKGPPETGDF